MKNNTGRFKNLFGTSFFINLLKKISESVYSLICSSKTAQLLTSYDAANKKGKDSMASAVLGKFKPRKKKILDMKNNVSNAIESGFFAGLLSRIYDFIMGCKLRVFGVIFFILGILSAGIGVIERYLIEPHVTDSTLLWQGILFVIFSIPLFVSKEDLGVAVVEGRITGAVTRFFGYKREDIVRASVGENMAIPVIVGVILGILSFVIQPMFYFVAVLGIIYVRLLFGKPEYCVMLAVASLPFLPTMVICAEIIVIFCAYFLKVIRGKRSSKFDILDVFVMIFATFMFLGGLFSITPSASLPPACVFVCFIAAYFLIVNLIKTKQLQKDTLVLSLISFAICSLYGIYQNFFAAPDTTWTDEEMFSDIATRVVSTFENPNVFGEYLIMLIPVALAFIIAYKSFAKRFACVFVFVVSFAALIYTWSRGAWLGCIGAMAIFLVIITKYALGTYTVGILSVPLLIPFLPSSVLDRFTSIGNMTDSSTSYRVFIWEATANMIKDHFVAGIGIGTEAYQTVYSEYALAGIERAPHSHNLYLQILTEIGILGFSVFLITLFLFFAKVFTFLKNNDNLESKLIVGAITCGLIAILIQGLTDYVWYNYRVFAFFWMMLALASAIINTDKSELSDDEKIYEVIK